MFQTLRHLHIWSVTYCTAVSHTTSLIKIYVLLLCSWLQKNMQLKYYVLNEEGRSIVFTMLLSVLFLPIPVSTSVWCIRCQCSPCPLAVWGDDPVCSASGQPLDLQRVRLLVWTRGQRPTQGRNWPVRTHVSFVLSIQRPLHAGCVCQCLLLMWLWALQNLLNSCENLPTLTANIHLLHITADFSVQCGNSALRGGESGEIGNKLSDECRYLGGAMGGSLSHGIHIEHYCNLSLTLTPFHDLPQVLPGSWPLLWGQQRCARVQTHSWRTTPQGVWLYLFQPTGHLLR